MQAYHFCAYIKSQSCQLDAIVKDWACQLADLLGDDYSKSVQAAWAPLRRQTPAPDPITLFDQLVASPLARTSEPTVCPIAISDHHSFFTLTASLAVAAHEF